MQEGSKSGWSRPCERPILEFPLDMEAREVAKELKREGWYAWATEYASIAVRIGACEQKGGLEERK